MPKIVTLRKIISKLFGKKEKPNHQIKEYKVGGQTFRVVEKFGNSMFKRAVAFERALRNVDLGMVREDLQFAFDKHREYVNSGNISKAVEIVGACDNNLSGYTGIRIHWQIANTFILLPDESLYELDTQASEKKLRLCEANKDIEFFFYRIVNKHMQSYADFIKRYEARGLFERHEKETRTNVFEYNWQSSLQAVIDTANDIIFLLNKYGIKDSEVYELTYEQVCEKLLTINRNTRKEDGDHK